MAHGLSDMARLAIACGNVPYEDERICLACDGNGLFRFGTPFMVAVRALVVAARTSGGVAGRDAGLCAALDAVERHLTP